MSRASRRGSADGLLLALSAVAISGCGGGSQQCLPCVEPDGTYGVELKSVEAVVEEVQVGQPPGSVLGTPQAERRFQLAAWYRDANDSIISGRFDPFHWTEAPPGSVVPDPFGRVTVRNYAAAPVTLSVTSPDGRFQDQVALRRWSNQSAAATADDVVVTDHGAGFPPSVVLVEERKSGECAWGRAWAFVGIAAVGQQEEQPCSLAVLSSDRAMVFQDPVPDTWVSTAQSPPTGSVITTAPGQPREVKITVFVAVTSRTVSLLSQLDLSDNAQLVTDVAAAAKGQAMADVTRTNMIYEANRVGIRIKADYVTLTATPNLPTEVGAMDPFDCTVPRNNLPRPPKADFAYEPDMISVYYVDWIDYPAEPPTHPGASGIHCPYRGSLKEGPVIYIAYTRQSTFTLAHEIAHALKLEHPQAKLGALNLMEDLLDDGPLGADARSRLTVGQVVRMNVENESWISQLPVAGPTRLCWPNSPCPPEELDAR